MGNAGERLKLSFGAGEPLRDFEYDDEAPWVTRADGGGKSLTKILSASGNRTDHPFSWRASVTNGGSPGSSDAPPFSGDAGLDQDGDGLSALLEHFHGSDDTIIDPAAALFSITESSQDFITFMMKRNLASDDLIWETESSFDLSNWTSAAADLIPLSNTDQEDGTAILTFRLPTHPNQFRFWRLKVLKELQW